MRTAQVLNEHFEVQNGRPPWKTHQLSMSFSWKFPKNGATQARLAALGGPAEMGHLHVRRRGVAIVVPGQMQTSEFF